MTARSRVLHKAVLLSTLCAAWFGRRTMGIGVVTAHPRSRLGRLLSKFSCGGTTAYPRQLHCRSPLVIYSNADVTSEFPLPLRCRFPLTIYLNMGVTSEFSFPLHCRFLLIIYLQWEAKSIYTMLPRLLSNRVCTCFPHPTVNMGIASKFSLLLYCLSKYTLSWVLYVIEPR